MCFGVVESAKVSTKSNLKFLSKKVKYNHTLSANEPQKLEFNSSKLTSEDLRILRIKLM